MRLAIVTGGSKGLGLALCQQFANEGFEVLEFSRSAPHSYSHAVDMASPQSTARHIADALTQFNPTTLTELVYISNAGTLEPIGRASKKPPDQVLANLNINIVSAIIAINEVVRHFQSSPVPKVIGSISSGAALAGYPGWSLYCAAKAGMDNFIRALALEQANEAQPFTPIIINPGVIDTDMQANIRQTSADDFPDVARFIQRKNAGQLGSPESVAAAVVRIVRLENLKPGKRYEVSDY